MAVLTPKVVARTVVRLDFLSTFPALEEVAKLLAPNAPGVTCTKCGASQKAFDAIVRALKADRELAVKLRDYVGFQTMDVVEKVDKNRVEVVNLA